MNHPATATRCACDRCRTRKTRCIVLDPSGTCARCLTQGAACVFSPTRRNKRQQINTESSNPCQGPDGSNQLEVFPDSTLDIFHPLSYPLPCADGSDVTLTPEMADMLGVGDCDPETTDLITHQLPPFADVPAATPQDHQSPEAWVSPQQNNFQEEEPSDALAIDVIHLLPCIQRDLHAIKIHLDAHPTQSPDGFLSSEHFGAFAGLVEKLHNLSGDFFSSKLTFPADGGGNPYPTDSSIGTSFISAITTMLEIYEVLVNRISIDSTFLNLSSSPEPGTPETEEQSLGYPFLTITSPCLSPLDIQEPDDRMQIGSFTPPWDLARWVSMNVLLYQISSSRKRLEKMQCNLLCLQSQFHLNRHLSSSSSTPLASSSSTFEGDAPVPVLTTESCVLLTQQCDHLLTRFRELDGVVMQGILWHQRNFQS